jgi:hypothetical protein
METTERIGEGLTFEKVWAALMENREQIKAVSEQMKETDKQIKETDKQMRESGKRLDKQLGKLGNRFGEMTEHLVEPNLVAKFKELGFTFERDQQDLKIRDQEGQIIAEIDIFLENGDRAMAVEVKTKPIVEDIDEHIERMEKLRRHADRHNDTRKYLGAIAGMVFGKSEKTYALKKGFYVLEPSGDTFIITEPKGEYHPHEW